VGAAVAVAAAAGVAGAAALLAPILELLPSGSMLTRRVTQSTRAKDAQAREPRHFNGLWPTPIRSPCGILGLDKLEQGSSGG
jgi:hypothetical protein